MRLHVRILIGTLATLALAIGVAAQKNDPAAVMLRAAIDKAQVDGDLNGAIKQFQAIVDKFAKTDRASAATALVRMAECYQKLGDSESRKIYERVVRDYADQNVQATEAARRLNMLSPPSAAANGAIARRQLWARYTQFGRPSRNGRYIPFVEFDENGRGSLNVRDLVRAENRVLVAAERGVAAQDASYPGQSLFSPDSSAVAYGWKTGQGYQLRLIGFDGRQQRTLMSNPEHEWLAPVGWSPDATRLLVKINARGGTGQIAFVTLATGAVQVLKSGPWEALGNVALSDDGRYVAYDFDDDSTAATRTVVVLAADGSREMRLTDGTSRDQVIGWIPGERSVAYLTFRAGSPEAWSVTISGSGDAAKPVLISRDMRGMQPLGFTDAGALLYTQIVTAGTTYTGKADWESAAISDVEAISTNLSADFGPDWSPDGRQIAYVAHRGTDIERRFIAIYSIADRGTREVTLTADVTIQTPSGNRWMPDGKSFLVNANGRAYAVDLSSGRLRELLSVPNGYPQTPQPLNQGKALFYHPREGLKRTGRLAIRDIEGGTDTEVHHPFEGAIAIGFAVSPDEQNVVLRPIDENARTSALYVMPVRGGATRQLVEVPDPVWPYAWTPDGRYVIYTRAAAGERRGVELRAPTTGVWIVPANGGTPRQITLPVRLANMRGVSVHPDGTRVAFTVSSNDVELWSLDNMVSSRRTSR